MARNNFSSLKKPYKPKTDNETKLIKAVRKLESDQETANLLRDLLTSAELKELSNRLEIAVLLYSTEMSYIQIAEKVKTSTTTVTRVAQWLYKGHGGYRKAVIDIVESE